MHTDGIHNFILKLRVLVIMESVLTAFQSPFKQSRQKPGNPALHKLNVAAAAGSTHTQGRHC